MGTHINLQIMSIKKMLDWIQLPGNNSIPALIASSHGCDQSSLPHNCHIELFEDVDYECAGKSFSWEQACNYADFIRNLPNGTKMIICACNAGESRSAALCAGLCEYYEYDSSWIWDSPLYHPNMLVFDMFTRALGVEIEDIQKDDLLIRNRRAFTGAIKRSRGQKA